MLSKAAMILALFVLIQTAQAQTGLPTSAIQMVSYKDLSGKKIAPCTGNKAEKFNSYISIRAERIVIKKNDRAYRSIFDKKRKAFPSVKFTALHNGKTINISKISNPTSLDNRQALADLSGGWTVLDRIPYSFDSPTIDVRIGTTADSNINSSISMFNEVSSVIYEPTLSSAATAGVLISNAVDRYFFAEGRTMDALNSSFNLPQTSDGSICEGAYVVFAAIDSSHYQKYIDSDVIWENGNLKHNGNPITDVSYAVFIATISDTYYRRPQDSLNNSSAEWAEHFKKTYEKIYTIYDPTENDLNNFKTEFREDFDIAFRSLTKDNNLLHREKQSILDHVTNNYNTQISVLMTKINNRNIIPKNQFESIVKQDKEAGIKINETAESIITQLEAGENVERLPTATENLRPSITEAIKTARDTISDNRVVPQETI